MNDSKSKEDVFLFSVSQKLRYAAARAVAIKDILFLWLYVLLTISTLNKEVNPQCLSIRNK
jgi:hypothetical protein